MTTPADSPVSRPAPSRWEIAYRRYREVERELTDGAFGWALSTLLHSAIEGRHAFKRRLAKYQAVQRGPNEGNLPEPPAALLREMQTFADLRSSYDSEPPAFVFEDIYHLAFHRLSSWRRYGQPIPKAEDCARLYRGQVDDDWDVGPSIYRRLPDGPARHAELQRRAVTACRLGHAIAQKLGLSFADGMAIAQHYSASDVLGVPTWLVDFSRDPWVGLFFATDGGKTGDCGIVWDIMPTEFGSHSAGTGNPIGALQLVVPPGVPRIDHQAGVFIVAPHPELFAQYVAFGWDTRFRQFTDLVFEDPVLGINKDTIYPPEDPFRATLAEIRGSVTDCGCAGSGTCKVPASLFADPSDPKTYEELLTCWRNEGQANYPDRPESPEVRTLLADLAQFHALLHSAPYVARLPSIVCRSLNRLHGAFDNLHFAALQGQPASLPDAVTRSYIPYASGNQEQTNALFEALDEIVPCRLVGDE